MEIKHEEHTASDLDPRIIARDRIRSLHPAGEAALDAVAAAGQVVRDGFAIRGRLQRTAKGIGDLVSEIDLRAEEAALRLLRISTPDYNVISEESPAQIYASGNPTWILDPLDASAAFLFGTNPSHPSVMLALRVNESEELAVVHTPLDNIWYFAVRGKGAYRSTSDTGLTRLGEHRLTGDLESSWVALNWYGDSAYESEDFKKLHSCLRSKGGASLVTVEAPHSSLACRMLTEGTPAAVVHDNSAMKVKQALWDRAPIRLLVEEAGGVFVDLEGRSYCREDQGVLVIAANPAIGAEILTRYRNDGNLD